MNGKDSNRHSDYFTGSSNRLNDNDESNAYEIPEPRMSENEYQIPNQLIKRVVAKKETVANDEYELLNIGDWRKKTSTDSFKNLTSLSAASSVRSTVVQCCIKPFKIFSIHTKSVKNCLKKL